MKSEVRVANAGSTIKGTRNSKAEKEERATTAKMKVV
jgi:hypothetical protein